MNEQNVWFIHIAERWLDRMDKKEALKLAAHDVFALKGYKATGISEIAKRAGVAVGSFYNYYESKETIFLDVYIAENDRVRQAMIDEIDWEMDIVELISQLFAHSRRVVAANRILAEWYNPAIARVLHHHYSSEAGKVANPFHQFLVKTFTSWMEAKGYPNAKIHDILQVYNLFYYMDMHISEDDFPDIGHTLEVLATNFVKGILK